MDCAKTGNLDGKELALLKKRIKDPAVIKFAHAASLHVEAFQVQRTGPQPIVPISGIEEHFGFECPGWFNLEYLGLRGKDTGRSPQVCEGCG